jgi:hypothetical protein
MVTELLVLGLSLFRRLNLTSTIILACIASLLFPFPRNWAEYNLSLKQRGSLSIWFDAKMMWEAEASGRRGRQQFSDAANQTCLTLKVLFGMPLRQTTGLVQSLLRLV